MYSAYQYVYMIFTILDVNDNAPTFDWPTYPEVNTLTDSQFYIGAVSLFAQGEVSPVNLVVSIQRAVLLTSLFHKYFNIDFVTVYLEGTIIGSEITFAN